ncbi:MAG TPA: exopolysaccharide biosynthesis protein [Brevundimonas sp.]|nr:exopolysaccharide biosynthesis protein [Brevundimonas sp.]
MSTRGHDLEDLLGQIQALADRDDRVRLRDLHDLIGVRAFGPLLLMMALVALTPIGAVPALPTALAIAVTLIAGQVVLGRNRLWLPDFVERRHVSSKKLKASVRALSRPARWLDAVVRPRLERLTEPPFDHGVALVCVAIALMIPPLEFVPFGVAAPALALALMGLALTARDGLVVILAAFVALGGAGAVLFWVL